MSEKMQSILIGSAVVTILSTSYLGFINCLCCAGVIIGAMVGVWHYTNTNELTLPAGEGAVMGLVAGAIGAAAAFLLNYVLISMGIRSDLAILELVLNSFGDSMPPEQVEAMEEQMGAPVQFAGMLVNGLIGIAVSSIFGAVGGAVGASIFKKGTDTSAEETV